MSPVILIILSIAVLVILVFTGIWIAGKKKPQPAGEILHHTRKSSFETGLHRTKKSFGERILNVFHLKKSLDSFYDDIEEILVTGDVGIDTTLEIIESFKSKVEAEKIENEEEMKTAFKNVLVNIIPDKRFELVPNKLNVIFVFGVNGVGKTTSIAKLSRLFKDGGKKVLIAACDTFRAAAGKQLAKWAYSIDVQIVKHVEGGAPGAVLYDAIDAAVSRSMDVLIVDTAGRFHNRQNLMQELDKLNKIIDKKIPDSPRYNLLVLDAGTGHNAFIQAKEFQEIVSVQGIILSKLDSSAKGGIVLPIAHKLEIPILFAGVGEKAEDILVFDRQKFIESLF